MLGFPWTNHGPIQKIQGGQKRTTAFRVMAQKQTKIIDDNERIGLNKILMESLLLIEEDGNTLTV